MILLFFYLAISVCAFNSLPKSECSNLFIVAAFSNKSFAGKASLPVKNKLLLTFTDDKVEILAVCLSKSCCLIYCLMLLLITLIFSLILIFLVGSSPILMDYLMTKLYHLIKIEMAHLYNLDTAS